MPPDDKDDADKLNGHDNVIELQSAEDRAWESTVDAIGNAIAEGMGDRDDIRVLALVYTIDEHGNPTAERSTFLRIPGCSPGCGEAATVHQANDTAYLVKCAAEELAGVIADQVDGKDPRQSVHLAKPPPLNA